MGKRIYMLIIVQGLISIMLCSCIQSASAPSTQTNENTIWCMLESTRYDGNGNQEQHLTRELDEHGNIISELEESYIGGNSVTPSEYKYTYDENGNKIAVTVTKQTGNGEPTVFSTGSYSNSFDADGRCLSYTEDFVMTKYGSGSVTGRFGYHNNGQLSFQEVNESGPSDNSANIRYEFDERGFLASYEGILSGASDSALRKRYTWDFDADSVPISYEVNDDSSEIETYYVTTDAYGNITEVHDSDGILRSSYTYTRIDAPSKYVLSHQKKECYLVLS